MKFNQEKLDIIVDLYMHKIMRESDSKVKEIIKAIPEVIIGEEDSIQEDLTPEQKKKLELQKKIEIQKEKKKSFLERHPLISKYKTPLLGMSDDVGMIALNLVRKVE
jgi:hypothetical protein